MTSPPTWRQLESRARALGAVVEHGQHEARIMRPRGEMILAGEVVYAESWLGKPDAVILRTAIAAALSEMERKR